MRKLKYHEYRLLRRADVLQWKRENNAREVRVVRRYRLPSPDVYHEYNKLVGQIQKLVKQLTKLPKDDAVRVSRTEKLLVKLYDMGLIADKTNLIAASKVKVSTVCRRRLPVVLRRMKFAESLEEATSLIEQGHVRIGPHIAKSPDLLVSRAREDFITWVDSSKIKRKVQTYNDQVDDYDLLNA